MELYTAGTGNGQRAAIAQDDRARQSSGGRTGGHDVGLPGWAR